MESVYVKLARYIIENYIKSGTVMDVPDFINSELLSKKAACFVSIHMKNGELRGCIGTIYPSQENVVYEIMHNAISASTRDPRFPPITKDELSEIVINVDILTEPIKIDSKNELNPKKYGVIVESGYKRGLLLPDLEGVDDIDFQIDIARQKGGISKNEKYILYKFEVKRYY